MGKVAERKDIIKQLQIVFNGHQNSKGIVETLIANRDTIKGILDKCKALELFNG